MRIAVCDDDKTFINEINDDIAEIKTENDIINIEEYLSGEKLIKDFHKGLFDIIILDIEMGCLNGLETAEYIRKLDSDVIIIFLTSYESFVYRGYEVKAFRYILKNQPRSMRLEQLQAAINECCMNSHTIVLPYKSSSSRFQLKDIMFILLLILHILSTAQMMLILKLGHIQNISAQNRKPFRIIDYLVYVLKSEFVFLQNIFNFGD